MTTISEEILEKYQVRKTKRQKTAFIEAMSGWFPEITVEQGGFGGNRNLVLGDVSKAKVIFGAHYDTCARLPFPNFITPKNFLAYILFSLAIVVPFLLLSLGLNWLWSQVTQNDLVVFFGSFLPVMAALVFLFMGGVPNPHTANDNTSGVITLCELIATLPEAQRAPCAFVFFGNEENGLLGSAFFVKKHKKEGLRQKLMINFDCVSDGDHMLFVQNKAALRQYGAALAQAFPSSEGKTVHLEKSSNTLYPSDQGNFPMSIGVAALKKNRLVGLYMDRIHTVRDTVFQEENIHFLVEGTQRFLKSI